MLLKHENDACARARTRNTPKIHSICNEIIFQQMLAEKLGSSFPAACIEKHDSFESFIARLDTRRREGGQVALLCMDTLRESRCDLASLKETVPGHLHVCCVYTWPPGDHGDLEILDRENYSLILRSSITIEDFAMAVRVLFSGGRYVQKDLLDALIKGRARQEQESLDDNVGKLTDGESEALELVARGKLNKEIAYILQISESAVKARLKRAYKRLGCHNRTAALFEARRLEIL